MAFSLGNIPFIRTFDGALMQDERLVIFILSCKAKHKRLYPGPVLPPTRGWHPIGIDFRFWLTPFDRLSSFRTWPHGCEISAGTFSSKTRISAWSTRMAPGSIWMTSSADSKTSVRFADASSRGSDGPV